MAAVIIKKKDVERLGKELLNEVYDFLYDKDILNRFKELKEEQKKLQKILNIKGANMNLEEIFFALDSIKLKMEMDEDLYFKTKAFLNIFRVFDVDYIYLEN